MYKHDAENSAVSESTRDMFVFQKGGRQKQYDKGRKNMTQMAKLQLVMAPCVKKEKAINSFNTDPKPSVSKKLNSGVRINNEVSDYR